MELTTVVENLKKRGYDALYCPDAATAKECALERIGDATVGIGGSATVRDLGLYNALLERGNIVHWHWPVEKAEKDAARREAIRAEVYLCSANALLFDGRILNIDGTGNRVAATTFGPKRVVMIIGRNKLVETVDEGIARTRRECCPQNARRQGLKTPCAATGVCADCASPDRMCNIFSIFERMPKGFDSFTVLLVDESLGL